MANIKILPVNSQGEERPLNPAEETLVTEVISVTWHPNADPDTGTDEVWLKVRVADA